MKPKMKVGPLKVFFGGAGQGVLYPKNAIHRSKTGSGYELTHQVRGDKHRVIIRDPQGQLMARITLSQQEWKVFASATAG